MLKNEPVRKKTGVAEQATLYDIWKKEQTMWEDYKVVRLGRERTRRAKTQLNLIWLLL